MGLQINLRVCITEEHFKHRIVDNNWHLFLQFQIERTRKLYQESWEGLDILESKGRIAVAAAALLYMKILDKIEANDYDNHSKRTYVKKRKKFMAIFKLISNRF